MMPMPLAGCQNPIGLREMKWGEAVSMTALDEIKRGCVGEESLALLWTDSCPKVLGIVSGDVAGARRQTVTQSRLATCYVSS